MRLKVSTRGSKSRSGEAETRNSRGRNGLGVSGVARVGGGAHCLLEPGVVDVPSALNQLVASGLLERTEQRPVVVVVVLDDLERPAVPRGAGLSTL